MTVSERFWKNVIKGAGLDACWEWTGKRTQFGYGCLKIGGRGGHWVRAHRYAYAELVGEIREGLSICHHCDNRLCVRPEHLFMATHRENQLDMARKGRASRGVGNPSAKLTEERVREMRDLYAMSAQPLWTYRSLSRRYGVSESTASSVVRRASWTHVV
jgi:hypothetical protein